MSQQSVTFYRWEDMPKEKVSDVLDRRLITGESIMLTHVYLKKGAIVPQHNHHNEQITYILEGGLRFTCMRMGSFHPVSFHVISVWL